VARTPESIPFGQAPRPAEVKAFSALQVFRYSSGRHKPVSARWHPNQLRHSQAAERRRHGLGLAKTIRGYGKAETAQLCAEKDIAAAMELVSELPRLVSASNKMTHHLLSEASTSE
jgi:hypothetical protein